MDRAAAPVGVGAVRRVDIGSLRFDRAGYSDDRF